MQEINLIKRKSTGSIGDLSISFENAVVGSKTFVDTGATKRVFTRGVIAGTPSVADGVVNDPTFGKCYRFNRYTYFNCTDLMQFSKGNYRIELDFVPINTDRINSVFRSGDYNGAGIKPGILLSLNQSPSSYFQAFCPYAGNFTRAYLNGQTNPSLVTQALEQIVLTKIGNILTIENKRTGIKTPNTIVSAATDSYLAFGASDDLSATYSFDGLLKRFQLFIL